MKWQTIVTAIIAMPLLALFGGVGFLAYQIGQTWDARSTDSLITGLVATCGGGAVVIGVLLALIVGIPLAIRAYGEAGQRQRAWQMGYPMRSLPPDERQLPARIGRGTGHGQEIEGVWHPMTPASSPAALPTPLPNASPPWGVTGGGTTLLLPSAQQDKRFYMGDGHPRQSRE